MLIQKIKYPRTYHVPWSPGVGSDDKVFTQDEVTAMFNNENVVVTEKLDGENTTIYHDGTIHARSLDSPSHETRSWVKHLATNLVGRIPEGIRICGENVYAKHSIAYTTLNSYFYVFGIYNKDICLSWEDTKKLCKEFGLIHVPEQYIGKWSESAIKQVCGKISRFSNECEGYVIRLAGSFSANEHDVSVAKYVRPNHVQSDEHWLKNWSKNIKV